MTGSIAGITRLGQGESPLPVAECDRRCIDLCLQIAVWADAAKTARRVARVIGGDAETLRARLNHPCGILIEAMPAERAGALCARLEGVKGVIVTQSDPAAARYDIHATRPLAPEEEAQLAAIRRLIGARPDPFTEAVAADLDRANRDALLQRLPDCGLLAIDRRFQRFDLLLTGVTGWTTVQLADFLVARTQKPRTAFEQLCPTAPVTLDIGLRADVARQFCADYATLGLLVRPVLSPRGRKA